MIQIAHHIAGLRLLLLLRKQLFWRWTWFEHWILVSCRADRHRGNWMRGRRTRSYWLSFCIRNRRAFRSNVSKSLHGVCKLIWTDLVRIQNWRTVCRHDRLLWNIIRHELSGQTFNIERRRWRRICGQIKYRIGIGFGRSFARVHVTICRFAFFLSFIFAIESSAIVPCRFVQKFLSVAHQINLIDANVDCQVFKQLLLQLDRIGWFLENPNNNKNEANRIIKTVLPRSTSLFRTSTF